MSEKHTSLNSLEFLERVREQLRYWPYTLHQIDDTLDINLIEGRGKQLLYRAIHSQNLTAFVGSGLSMSYGRLSWRDWQKEQKRVVDRNTELFCALARAARAWNAELRYLVQPQEGRNADQAPHDMPPEFQAARDFIHTRGEIEQMHRHSVWQWLRTKDRAIEHSLDQIERLKETFKLTQESGGHFPGGEELPVKFEIAQQLHNQLKKFTGLFLPDLPTDLSDEERKKRVWAGAYAPERQSAPTEGLRKLRKFYGHGEKKLGLELLNRLKEEKEKFDNAFAEFDAALTRPESHLSFEDLAKALLIDECPHALILIRQGLLKGLDPDKDANRDDFPEGADGLWKNLEKYLDIFDRRNQRRDIGGIRDYPARYRILTPFLFTNFGTIRDVAMADLPAQSRWRDFWTTVIDLHKEYLEGVEHAGDSRTYLTPSSRFLVSVALSQCNDPFMAIGIKERGDLAKNPFFEEPTLKAFTSRRSIMAGRLDPLSKIERDLGVRNFITTNYDFEIERYFVDQGYRSFEPPAEDDPETVLRDPASDEEKFRSDNIGRVLKDQTFSPVQGSELTRFGLDDRPTGANVFHLHGRATEDGNLVITENDYMKLYLTQDENRDTVDEGISIAFSGAPLLFLGLGMEETDLLRPLRQFISNRDRTVGYTSIALLPADRGMAARAKFSAALFLRYGVHTIFYGSGSIRITYEGAGGEKVEKDRGIDWLYRMVSLKGALSDIVDDFLKGKRDYQQSEIISKLYEDVGEIGPDLQQDGYPATTKALNVLLGLPDEKPVDMDMLAARLLNRTRVDYLSKGLLYCTFTPVRPRSKEVASPHQNERDATVEGRKYLRFYTALMTQILRITVALPEMGEDERKKSLMPLKLALDGLHGAFITASLNAALEGIALGKHQWWRDWQESPPERLAQAQRLEPPAVAKARQFVPITAGPDDAIKVGTSFVRHRVDNVITILDEKRSLTVTPDKLLDQDQLKREKPARLAEEFRTRIRAYDTFVAAVACQMRHRPLADASKRQIITVAARRGMGKGTFMSAFSSSLGQQTYKCAAWPQKDVVIAGSIFLNLGFSPEIGSAFDMLTNALINVIALLRDLCRRDRLAALDTCSWKGLSGGLAVEQKASANCQDDVRKGLREDIRDVSRLTALRMLFQNLAVAAENVVEREKRFPRMLINISSVDLLFDEAQRPKNGEIDRFLNMLFSKDLAECPIDIVFLGDDTCLGGPWNTKPKIGLMGKTEGREYPEEENQTEDEDDFVPPEEIHDHGPLRCRLDRAFLPELAEEQIRRSIRTGQISIDEPYDAWRDRVDAAANGLSVDIRSSSQQPQDEKPTPEHHYIHFTRPMNAISLLVDNFPVLATALYVLNPPRREEDREKARDDRVETDPDDDWWEDLSKALRKGRDDSDGGMSEIWARPKLPDKYELAKARGLVAQEVKQEFESKITQHAIDVDLNHSESRDYETALRERLRPAAYADGVQEWRKVRRSLGNSRFSLTMLLAAAETTLIHSQKAKTGAVMVQQFIRDIVSQVHTIGQERRDQMVLDAVLALYRRLHVIGNPDLDCEFHFLILRHLGVIGTPVGSAVLIRLAEFRAYFDRIGIELEVSRRRFLVRALTVLAYRGLVFRLEPHPRLVFLQGDDAGAAWKAEEEYRYALHRVVQNFALRNLEAGTTDPFRHNSFAPSLYAVMPSSGPRLSRSSHMFLRSLMIGLSQYPDISNQDTSVEPWLFTSRDTSVRVQALRAAMTLARSTFSVAVVSRMATHKPIGESTQKRGLLETYRVRLRWIIRMAWEISDEAGRLKKSDKTLPETIRVLYRDEIVWLYNELGVISLAQGSLSDALGYLRQAAEKNEDIEGRSRNAPIFNHIDLNHAIVQLERGNFKSARTRLDRVHKATSPRKWKVYWAAEGYRCVLDHLVGRREGVFERFCRVTQRFQEDNEARAAAIFLMHQGRFIAEENSKEAFHLLKRARNLSETDGHEDIRHHVELAQIRLRIREAATMPLDGTEMRSLQEVENFGRRTSIWSLQADALWLRANILLAQGEMSSAGRLLIRSMAISKRNSMMLRLNNAMTSYAEVLLLRGDVAGALGVARQSLDQAKRTGYSLETARAQAVLTRCQDMPR